MYEYNAKIDRIVDGDTIDATLDLGFHLSIKLRLRLLDLDAPELRSRSALERLKARTVSDKLKDLLLPGLPVKVRTNKTGKYGRWLANVWYKDIFINDLIREWINEVNDLYSDGSND